jgi:hypothetical protein
MNQYARDKLAELPSVSVRSERYIRESDVLAFIEELTGGKRLPQLETQQVRPDRLHKKAGDADDLEG